MYMYTDVYRFMLMYSNVSPCIVRTDVHCLVDICVSISLSFVSI